jgi:glycosyltransferase involved in cell wall biosynthesis
LRQLKPYFDPEWYLAAHADLRERTVLDPFDHYAEHGLFEGRDPNPFFSNRYYLQCNPDVRAAGMLPILHYINFGWAEGRNPHVVFDAGFYLERYPDVRSAGVDPLLHYLKFGARELRQPHPVFDVVFYCRQLRARDQATGNPLAHFLIASSGDLANPHPLFDVEYYVDRYPDVRRSGVHPWVHYLEHGGLEGRRPHPLFDGRWYLSRYPDVRAHQRNPLVHFVLKGGEDDLDPCPQFDASFYRRQIAEVGEEVEPNPLIHYLTVGQAAGLMATPVFDAGQHAAESAAFIERFSNGRPTVLMVLHNLGGGTEFHVWDLIRLLQSQANFVVLSPSSSAEDFVNLQDAQDERSLEFDTQTQWNELIHLLHNCNVERVHIHHHFGMESFLRSLVETLNVPFDFTVHDLWMLGVQRIPHATVSVRQERLVDWIVSNADRIFVPSNHTAAAVQTRWPEKVPIVAAHPDRFLPIEPVPPRIQPGCPLRVAVLGTLVEHKGAQSVLECAQLARQGGTPVKFMVVGEAPGLLDVLSAADCVVTGQYHRDDVLSILARLDIQALWYPLTVPETFSYTLSEGLASGLPLVVQNIGALPERVAGREWTWVLDAETTADDTLAVFVDVRKACLIGCSPPRICRELPQTRFSYQTDYVRGRVYGEAFSPR